MKNTKVKKTVHTSNKDKNKKKRKEFNMNKQELIQFLKDNLKVSIWCDYDGCDTPQVNVGLYLGDEEISKSSDYLPL